MGGELPPGCRQAQDALHQARMGLMGQTTSRSNVQQTLDAEAKLLAEKSQKAEAPLEPRKPVFPLSIEDKAKLLSQESLSFLIPVSPYERSLATGGGISYDDVSRLFRTAGVRVDQKVVQGAMYEFKQLSTSGVVDIPRFDLILERIGVRNHLLKHQLFQAFDTDSSNTVRFGSILPHFVSISPPPFASICLHFISFHLDLPPFCLDFRSTLKNSSGV